MDNTLFTIIGSATIGGVFTLIVLYRLNKVSRNIIEAINDAEYTQSSRFSQFVPEDELFAESIRLTKSNSGISTYLLQNTLRIGYARACYLIDKMIESKIVEQQPIQTGESYMYRYIPRLSEGETLQFLIGTTVSGKTVYGDFRKTGHFISSGQTGSGHASYDEGAFVTSLIQAYSPKELRFIMIDPKQVQLSPYKDIPHLLRPVIHTPDEAKDAVRDLLDWTDARFNILVKAKVKDIVEYNQQATERLPYIILLIPEIADLMMVDDKFYTDAFLQFAMISKAVGIHIYLGTQRPSNDVLPDELIGMISGRLVFRLANKIDSDNLLAGQAQAHMLKNQGELYYMDQYMRPIKLKANYVSDEQITEIVKSVKGTITE